MGVELCLSEAWGKGSAGAETLAKSVVDLCESGEARFSPLYDAQLSLTEKLKTLAKEIYRADSVDIAPKALKKIAQYEEQGFGSLPICVAKTQNSISHEKTWRGAPKGYVFPIRDVQLYAGAGFVVAFAGDIMTMPGLPKTPAAQNIDVDDQGNISGLF